MNTVNQVGVRIAAAAFFFMLICLMMIFDAPLEIQPLIVQTFMEAFLACIVGIALGIK